MYEQTVKPQPVRGGGVRGRGEYLYQKCNAFFWCTICPLRETRTMSTGGATPGGLPPGPSPPSGASTMSVNSSGLVMLEVQVVCSKEVVSGKQVIRQADSWTLAEIYKCVVITNARAGALECVDVSPDALYVEKPRWSRLGFDPAVTALVSLNEVFGQVKRLRFHCVVAVCAANNTSEHQSQGQVWNQAAGEWRDQVEQPPSMFLTRLNDQQAQLRAPDKLPNPANGKEVLFNFVVTLMVGRCRLTTVSKPVLKAPMVSALETKII
jgi:hypothetical protein